MIDDGSDWMSFHDAVAYVEATQKCYQQRAIDLLRLAANDLKLRTRTVDPPPGWREITPGSKSFCQNQDQDIEFWRKGVIKLWPERQEDATRPLPPKTGSAPWNAISSVIDELWPNGIISERASVRNQKIHDKLKSQG